MTSNVENVYKYHRHFTFLFVLSDLPFLFTFSVHLQCNKRVQQFIFYGSKYRQSYRFPPAQTYGFQVRFYFFVWLSMYAWHTQVSTTYYVVYFGRLVLGRIRCPLVVVLDRIFHYLEKVVYTIHDVISGPSLPPTTTTTI